MRLRSILRILGPLLLVATAAHAQRAAEAPGANELRRLCATLPAAPTDGLGLARRAECVLSGVLPSADRIAETRALARKAVAAGEPGGGLMLFLAFQSDPANQYVTQGKVDAEAYRRLAARSVQERKDQIEAIEALGFAAGRDQVAAGLLLAGYFHDTVAPRNVVRLAALADLLARKGEHGQVVARLAREAAVIAKSGGGTKASARGFFEAYPLAVAAARAGYAAQNAGKACETAELKSLSAGDIQGAEYLPLTGPMVAETYLMKGRWAEYWTFRACEQDVPVKMAFEADGWGGSTVTAVHNKGE
jgi:hypothetical protein